MTVKCTAIKNILKKDWDWFLILPPSLLCLCSSLAKPILYFLAILFLLSTFAVIQDVDNASLEGQYQSFASLMEQRLAELFVLAGQQGTRFRRATTVGSYTVQVRSWHGSRQGGSLPGRRFSGTKKKQPLTHGVREWKSFQILDSDVFAECPGISVRRLLKALIQFFLVGGGVYGLFLTVWIFHEMLIHASAHTCMITCGQPLIIRERLRSSSANCSSQQARGWVFY